MSKLTREEFELAYANASELPLNQLHDMDEYAIPCNCDEPGCKGWQMRNLKSLFGTRHLDFSTEHIPDDWDGQDLLDALIADGKTTLWVVFKSLLLTRDFNSTCPNTMEMPEDKIVFRYKLGGRCPRCEHWRRHVTEPAKIHITVMRPSSLCYGASQKYGGIELILPEQEERIFVTCDDWPYGELEIFDFQVPVMGSETYLSLKKREEKCNCG